MRSHSPSVRTLSVTAAVLAATYVGCAAQEDAESETLAEGIGSESSAGSAGSGSGGGAAGDRPSGTGGASGSSPRPEAGSSGTAGNGGSSTSVAGAAGSSATTGGSAGAPQGGVSSGGTGVGGRGGAGGGAGTSTTSPDTSAPSTPGSLESSAITSTSVTVTWDASSDNVGVTGYRLYNGNNQVTTITGTIYTFKGLGAGTAYTFGVEAYDAADNRSARATKGASTTGAAPCNAGNAVAKLTHGQAYTANGNACIELVVNPAWNPVDVLLEQTGGGSLTYTYQSCKGTGTGTIDTVLNMFAGTNPGCNFFVRLTGSGTVVYYD